MNERKMTYEELLEENERLRQEIAEANKTLSEIISWVEWVKNQNTI